MNFMSFAPFAILLEFDFTFNAFFVFSTPVVDAFTFIAGEFYEMLLSHAKFKRVLTSN